ncbi:MAG: hypothetical protein HZA22_07280 [Nitrospirae bacterium]|nr:hypothetical protein [Nitrospirota bacterium]MBI5695840.1 hypothetical protein [Nitrospirota bacterium]
MGSSHGPRKKPFVQAVLWGAVSVAMYYMLLTNQEMLNGTFARGGLYALLPIVTAFAFSIVHGSFTGHFWTVFGVEASKKKKEAK